MSATIPVPDSESGLAALQAMRQQGHILAALETFHARLGNVFQINLPGFKPVMLVGPEAARFVLVTGRDQFAWRNETDPVTTLLQRGVLVVDGEEHDGYRGTMTPALHKRMLNRYVGHMVSATDEIITTWGDGEVVDMLVEMRKIALLIIMRSLNSVGFSSDMPRLWDAILKSIEYISPGAWLIWPGAPRFGYQKHLDRLNGYLFEMIAHRRANPVEDTDLLSDLIASGLDDQRIRDQILTMIIAGHDTSTANLAWSHYLLGMHRDALMKLVEEVDTVLGDDAPTIDNIADLTYTGQVSDEALRLYPPIHLGNRKAKADIAFGEFMIPADTRVIYSIYLTHRHPEYWDAPAEFRPERFEAGQRPTPYSYLPFGGGPRNCIGGAFAQVESKVVLSRIMQQADLTLEMGRRIVPSMGATLEPRPGVPMRVHKRGSFSAVHAPSGRLSTPR